MSLVYDLKAKTATVNGRVFTGIEIVDIWRVGVSSGVVDFKEKKATLTFFQPVEAKIYGTATLCLLPAQPPPPPPPPPPRRRRRRTAEVAEAWVPGTGVSVAAERALSAVESVAGPLLLPLRRDYEFSRVTYVGYDGAFHWIDVKYLEDSAKREVTITRKLKRVVFSNLGAEGLYMTLVSAYYVARFIEVSHGDFSVFNEKYPFRVKIAGREVTVSS